nr:uncharacterized protein LOC112938812 [Oryza sativa Japonica Group]
MHTGHLWKKIHSSYDKMTIWPIMLLLQLHKALSISSQESSQNFHRLGYKKQGSPFSAVQGPRNMTDQIAVSSDNQEQIWIYHIWRIYLYGKGGTRGTFAISSYQVLELLVVLLIILYNLPGRTNCSPPRRPRAGDTGGNPSAASATLSSSPSPRRCRNAPPENRAASRDGGGEANPRRRPVSARGWRAGAWCKADDAAWRRWIRRRCGRIWPPRGWIRRIHAGSGRRRRRLAAGGWWLAATTRAGGWWLAAAGEGGRCMQRMQWRRRGHGGGGGGGWRGETRLEADACGGRGRRCDWRLRRPAHMEARLEAGVRGGRGGGRSGGSADDGGGRRGTAGDRGRLQGATDRRW